MELKSTTYDVADRIATVTLARPHRLNAWTGRMHTEYRWCLEQAEAATDVRVVIVTGEGRAFCAGADTTALDGHAQRGGYDDGLRGDVPEPGYGVRPEFDQTMAFHFGLTKPVIAAINGACAGMGLVLACFCDLRFAAPGAKMTTAHGRLGLPAEYGLSWLLPRLIGLTRANELLLSSRIFLSDEAAEIGLVNDLFPADELIERVRGYAHELAHRVSAESLRETKRQIYTDLHRDVGSSVEEADALLRRMVTHADFAEGVRAFQEKRPPEF